MLLMVQNSVTFKTQYDNGKVVGHDSRLDQLAGGMITDMNLSDYRQVHVRNHAACQLVQTGIMAHHLSIVILGLKGNGVL